MTSSKIYVAGHRGMVGSAIQRALRTAGHSESAIVVRSRTDLDLTDQTSVRNFFEAERPDQVYLAAAKVGGIYANNEYPAEFIYENLSIQCNVIEAAFRSGVKRLLFLGSSCIYPKMAPQPMLESSLLAGPLEQTNEPYAIAKIAGIKLCESLNRQYGDSHGLDYRSLMPTNLYGPGDNYHPHNSHVIPALIRRFHEAKVSGAASVTVWGSGNAMREFLHVDDLAAACLYVMNLPKHVIQEKTTPQCSHINVGSDDDVTIRALAETIKNVVGFKGDLAFDQSMPDGAPRKLMDSGLIKSLGWSPAVSLKDGLSHAYADFCQNDRRA